MENNSNKTLAKNTLFLYLRTLLTMCISLYTSRVFLDALGISDYGIYNVVGGFVSMFSIITGALSASISRFVTFELGKKNGSRINEVFCTSINIQIVLISIVFLGGELFGPWFIDKQLNIPVDRILAAKWVFQCSLLSFAFNLLSVPYNACLIAHEKMKVFAYISILEAVLKLSICYALIVTIYDRLIVYSFLFLLVSIVIRFIYGIYCGRNFSECKYRKIYDKPLFLDMLKFSGWSFLSNATGVINTQGVNVIINMFFGVTLNAARGVAVQIQSAVMQFVNNFSVALNPQIIKSVAAEDFERSKSLVYSGAKISFFLVFLFSIPIIFEAEEILSIWLKQVPDYSVLFLRLSFIGIMIDVVGNSSTIACCATGNIKQYTILVSSIGLLVLPISWMLYKYGFPVESTYYVYIIIYIGINFARLYSAQHLLGFKITAFVNNVLLRLILTASIALIFPIIIYLNVQESLFRLIIMTMVCLLSTTVSILYIGLSKLERTSLINFIRNKVQHA